MRARQGLPPLGYHRVSPPLLIMHSSGKGDDANDDVVARAEAPTCTAELLYLLPKSAGSESSFACLWDTEFC